MDAFPGIDAVAAARQGHRCPDSLHNARITWVSPDESWEASVFGTNITDERAIQSKLNFLNLFGSLQTTFVRPEEWAMSVKKRF